MPSDDLVSNWAYMVIAALAWNLKAWVGLWMPNKVLGKRIVRMEFKRFLNTFMKIPCLIVKAGRRITYRVVGYNRCLKDYLRRLLDDQGVPGHVEEYSWIGPSLQSTPLTNTHQRRIDLNHVPQFSRAINNLEGRSTPSVWGRLTNLQQFRPVLWPPALAVICLPIRACFGTKHLKLPQTKRLS